MQEVADSWIMQQGISWKATVLVCVEQVYREVWEGGFVVRKCLMSRGAWSTEWLVKEKMYSSSTSPVTHDPVSWNSFCSVSFS